MIQIWWQKNSCGWLHNSIRRLPIDIDHHGKQHDPIPGGITQMEVFLHPAPGCPDDPVAPNLTKFGTPDKLLVFFCLDLFFLRSSSSGACSSSKSCDSKKRILHGRCFRWFVDWIWESSNFMSPSSILVCKSKTVCQLYICLRVFVTFRPNFVSFDKNRLSHQLCNKKEGRNHAKL